MKILHISAGWQPWNGAAGIARMIMREQEASGHVVSSAIWAGIGALRSADEVWIHCGWLPCLWWAALWGRRVRWMPEACYDPVRLAYHAWKKRLAGPFERFFLRRANAVVATCEAEAGWIRAYLGRRCPPVEVTDIKRFFRLPASVSESVSWQPRHILYLGRRHPLKGLEYLEKAVGAVRTARGGTDGIELRIVSGAFGEEKERVWDWCDTLVLPTLSDNFGLVVAEALERGKRVVTTDGAPAWGDGNTYGGRLVYLRGFRDGSGRDRVELIRSAIG